MAAPKFDIHAFTLTISLESILQTTFRPEMANSSVKLIGYNGTSTHLNSSNLSEAICTRLCEGTEVGGAVSYLYNCFKRLLAKENGCDDKIRQDLHRFERTLFHFIFRFIFYY
jgi:hypothetical protein